MDCNKEKPFLKIISPSDSSNYFTNGSTMDILELNVETRRHSKILAGSPGIIEAISSDEYYSLSDNSLDKNIDILNTTLNSSELDIDNTEAEDCSTSYYPLKSVYTLLQSAKLNKNSKDDLEKKSAVNDIKFSSEKGHYNNTGGYISQIIKDLKKQDKYNNFKRLEHVSRKLVSKKVIFAEDNKENRHENVKKHDPALNSLVEPRSRNKLKERDINENVHHNTTESFIFWENWCYESENSVLHKSQSCTALSNLSTSYTSEADDEFSVTTNVSCIAECNSTKYSTFPNDTFPPAESSRVLEERESHTKFRRRADSCDSILRDVQKLPQEACQIILRAVFEQLEKVRNQNHNYSAYCSHHIPRPLVTDYDMLLESCKSSDKELCSRENFDHMRPPTIVYTTSPKLDTEKRAGTHKNSAMKKNVIVRGLYSWEKKVTSPVGEYIKGKRPSPFKTSPNKRTP